MSAASWLQYIWLWAKRKIRTAAAMAPLRELVSGKKTAKIQASSRQKNGIAAIKQRSACGASPEVGKFWFMIQKGRIPSIMPAVPVRITLRFSFLLKSVFPFSVIGRKQIAAANNHIANICINMSKSILKIH